MGLNSLKGQWRTGLATRMVKFSVNTHRQAPYKRCKFRVKWDGRSIVGVNRVSGLRRTTEPVADRDGGDPNVARSSPGLTKYDPIVLERGRTHDSEFERWANKVHRPGGGLGSEVSLADYKKDVVIELYNEAGQLAMAYKVYRCWPSEYVPLDELDASASETATERLTLQHEGWERDEEVPEPEEPSFSVPDR